MTLMMKSNDDDDNEKPVMNTNEMIMTINNDIKW